tara:strand:- start:21777 stop:21926 length:150 start_codon:yes stop_codon:yes gene_type:complete
MAPIFSQICTAYFYLRLLRDWGDRSIVMTFYIKIMTLPSKQFELSGGEV